MNILNINNSVRFTLFSVRWLEHIAPRQTFCLNQLKYLRLFLFSVKCITSRNQTGNKPSSSLTWRIFISKGGISRRRAKELLSETGLWHWADDEPSSCWMHHLGCSAGGNTWEKVKRKGYVWGGRWTPEKLITWQVYFSLKFANLASWEQTAQAVADDHSSA